MDAYPDGGAGASLTNGIIIVMKRTKYHYEKIDFIFENDRLRFHQEYLKIFTFFKEQNITVNLVCKNGDIQEDILNKKHIDDKNTEITSLGNIKGNLDNQKTIGCKIINIEDKIYNLL